MREANLNPVRPTEAEMKNLDSSMKRNTALIRKLKQASEDSRKSILDDIAKANQSKVSNYMTVNVQKGIVCFSLPSIKYFSS